MVRYTLEQKEQAVVRLCAGDGTAKEIASELGTTEGSLYVWKRRLLSERCRAKVPKKKLSSSMPAANNSADSAADLAAEKQTLAQQVADLKEEVHRLQLERDILEKAGELLKKTRASITKH